METILSRHNALVRRARELARGRPSPGDAVLLEGRVLLEEALASDVAIEVAAFAARLADDEAIRSLARAVEDRGGRTIRVPEEVMNALSPATTPTGITTIARLVGVPLASVFQPAPACVIVADTVQDPGNLGAIIRTAEAGGATGVVTTALGADPRGWKVLRGSMGSAFRLPVSRVSDLQRVIDEARTRAVRVLATAPHGGVPLYAVDLRGPLLVVLGGEGAGLRPETLAMADVRMSIPMRPPVESLNVAATAAVVVFEAFRQRTAAA